MISANLAQNRVRLIHVVDYYTEIYGLQFHRKIQIFSQTLSTNIKAPVGYPFNLG